MNLYNLYFYRYGVLFVFALAVILGFWLHSDTLNVQKKLNVYVNGFSKIMAFFSLVFVITLLIDLNIPPKTSHEIIEARHTTFWEHSMRLDMYYQTEVFTNYRRLFLYRNLHISNLGDQIEVLLTPIFEIYKDGRLFKNGEYTHFNEGNFAAVRIPFHQARINICMTLLFITSLLLLLAKPMYLKYSLPLVLLAIIAELRVALYFLDNL